PGPDAPSAVGWDPPGALWATAGGIALLAQLPPEEVAPFVAENPWPRYSAASPASAADVLRLVAEVRAGEAARETAWSHPAAACLAVPWPALEPGVPSVLALTGRTALIARNDAVLERLLRRAVNPAASPEDLAGDGLTLARPTTAGA
ncbi:MAG: hypothetical protein F2817_21320, partial [Actinobacteria bacterium]|nr:hypothetical protein [Actinomycetota bacterium]